MRPEKILQSEPKPQKKADKTPTTKAGDNTRYLLHVLEIGKLTDDKIDMQNTEAVAERVNNYFKICARNDMKPNVSGLGLCFGVHRNTILKWANGTNKSIPREAAEVIEKAVLTLNAQIEDYMYNSKINPANGIFIMKNNFDYEEKKEVVVSPNNIMGDETPPEVLQQKYLTSAVDEEVKQLNP